MDSSAISNSIAALRSSIKNLASSSDSLRPWLHFFVTLVAIGVVLEVVFVLWEYCERRNEYRRGTIRSPQKPSGWKLFFELFGVGLVAIGVAGELVVDIKSDAIQTNLREKNGELIQLLEDVSSAALTTASQNEKDAASLRRQATILTQRNLATESHLTEANQELEDERKKTFDMEVWLSPRVLPMIGEPRGLTWERIVYYSGINANINSVVDEESRRAAGQIAAVIRKAGWNIVGLTSDSNRQVTLTDNLGTTQMADGVTVLSHRTPKSGVVGTSFDEPRSKEAAGVLSDLLDDNGWDVVAVPGDPDPNARLWVPPNTVRIEVGLKPNPYISPNLPKNIQEQRKKIIEQDRQAREARHRAREHEQIQETQWLLFHPLAPSPVVPPNPKPEK